MKHSNPFYETKPDNNLVIAILVTLFCCLPFGIVAIIKASSVDSLWQQGRYEEARKAARQVKTYSLVSALFLLIPLILYIGVIIVLALLGVLVD